MTESNGAESSVRDVTHPLRLKLREQFVNKVLTRIEEGKSYAVEMALYRGTFPQST